MTRYGNLPYITGMDKITVRIDEELLEKLRALSVDDGRSLTFLINKAVANYLAARKVS